MQALLMFYGWFLYVVDHTLVLLLLPFLLLLSAVKWSDRTGKKWDRKQTRGSVHWMNLCLFFVYLDTVVGGVEGVRCFTIDSNPLLFVSVEGNPSIELVSSWTLAKWSGRSKIFLLQIWILSFLSLRNIELSPFRLEPLPVRFFCKAVKV